LRNLVISGHWSSNFLRCRQCRYYRIGADNLTSLGGSNDTAIKRSCGSWENSKSLSLYQTSHVPGYGRIPAADDPFSDNVGKRGFGNELSRSEFHGNYPRDLTCAAFQSENLLKRQKKPITVICNFKKENELFRMPMWSAEEDFEFD
jgi:hypothetical protein